MKDTNVLFEIMGGGGVGVITLNRPEVLNALTESMFVAISAQLSQWEEQDTIKAVVIRGAGERAFCAGGDLRTIYESRNNTQILPQFFEHEYKLDRQIYHFSKPYISLLNGLAMGGGLGLSVNGSFRVGTEKLILAMPETKIGFFADAGATYFLSRCKDKIGWYLGLTGNSISVCDACYAGLVDVKIKSADIPILLDKLIHASWIGDPKKVVKKIIESFAVLDIKPTLAKYIDIIKNCFSQSSVELILTQLSQQKDPWAKETLSLLLKRSPTSLKVVFEALTRGSQLSFDECMNMEYKIACQFLQTPDFFEGIRAAVIDKDKSPRWEPNELSQVSEARVAQFYVN